MRKSASSADSGSSAASAGGSLPPAEEPAERRVGERSEPPRSEAGSSAAPDAPTQVRPRPTRRNFSAEYKLDVLRQVDACRVPGEIGAVLRREGLYFGHLSKWRAQRRLGALAALTERRRGPKPPAPEAREVAKLRRENARLLRELAKANLCLEIQKKVSEMLGIPLNPPPHEGNGS